MMRDCGDLKQKLQSVATLSIEGIRVLLGCFLMLFVSQKCGDSTCQTSDILDTSNGARDTFWTFHLLSAVLVISSFILEARREKWLINQFDSDPGKPDQAMQESWVRFPKKHVEFVKRTRFLKNVVGVAGVVYLVNWLGTTIFLIGWHWNGISTLTGLFTQGILVVQSLGSTYNASSSSLTRNVPISTVLTEPVVFNKWDEDITPVEPTTNEAESASAHEVEVNI